MEDITEGSIASPHWGACETCRNFGQNGCTLPEIDIYMYLGDFIICRDYDDI